VEVIIRMLDVTLGEGGVQTVTAPDGYRIVQVIPPAMDAGARGTILGCVLARDAASPEALARGVLQLADAAGMPGSFWQADSRVRLARDVLGVPADGRITHARLWHEDGDGEADEDEYL
jgi:hypothetical protein